MSNSITPITEDDIANFLVNTPDFFERHAQLLSSVRFVSPHGQRAVSLQERPSRYVARKNSRLRASHDGNDSQWQRQRSFG